MMSCEFFLFIYFPFIGIVACLSPSVVLGLYLSIGLYFYLLLNTAFYKSHIKNNLMHSVLVLVKQWRKGSLDEADNVKSGLNEAR